MNEILRNLRVNKKESTTESESCIVQTKLKILKQSLTPANQAAKLMLLSLLARYD